jgi:hypothetical protein
MSGEGMGNSESQLSHEAPASGHGLSHVTVAVVDWLKKQKSVPLLFCAVIVKMQYRRADVGR